MPDFTFEALARTGAKSTGTLTANSEREAALILDGRGLFPLKIGRAKTQASSAGGFFGGRVSGRATATLYSQLADLLHSGVPLLRSLELLERQSANRALQSVLRDIRARVADGTGLAQAMAFHPRVFNELAVSMVRAGQEGGFLEDVLKRIAAFVEHQEDLKSKVVGSLAYPAFLGFAGFGVVAVLMVFFVPKFESIFEKLKEKDEMPEITSLLLWISHSIRGYWWLVISAVVGAAFGFRAWARTPNGRLIVDRVKIRLPLFGPVFMGLALSRFCRILGTMLHNGIPLLKALHISKDSTGNKVLAAAVEQAAENVTAGQKLADPLRKSGHFPTDIVEMITIAEEANSLEKVLIDVADGLDKRTARNLELMVKLLEPIMLLAMAAVVGTIAVGLLMPVFKLSTTLK
ncbi:type iv pilus biogenesis protein : Type II secretion system F domain protein OS=Planctomyces brasiliensis (strain ATCC 49424 / DSM 5305 / JCM 21570 / NBRC 103401 / IFAM 1448) GN=Plabr_3183 PE=3 SV=1: T2SF: T2SF [Gemmata massiliana]|uniref:General secretion pathway protein F n=1 Tax=Gemmata massiliana TaxID=1210884 RepID=A0A6P2CSA7_9BACT|nr:type II secretion system F family protein [Gemmata massiliana]VTR91829.1 type iv pilus biogenesis protein : Type II secretion system F domain protein OS=Planctomyces brasiliensis (strain ATCC 49424 / DSM 5305 / JCM 21570 / NBRC 103401 / IFAM 1448) GN=Plabr_3183 PE=3 SV=1: T2SF: T2SF [Gemmata massiliana]